MTTPTDVAQPESTEPPALPPVSPAPARPRPRTRLRSGRGRPVLAGALVFLLVEGLGSSLNYFDTVHQALAQKATLGTTTLRLEGVVVPGKLVVDTPVGTDFTVAAGDEHGAGATTPARRPQLFQPDIPVVVVGHFASVGSDSSSPTRSW